MNKKYGSAVAIAAAIIIISLVFAFGVYPMFFASPPAPPPGGTTTTTSTTPIITTTTSTTSTSSSTAFSSSSSSSSSSASSSSSSSSFSSSSSSSSTSSTSSSSSSTSSSSSSTKTHLPPPPPPPGSGNPTIIDSGQGGNGSITIWGENLNHTQAVNYIAIDLRINGNSLFGKSLPGIPVTLTHLQYGVQYGVVVYWYGNWYIRYINDTNTGIDLQRYDLVTLSSSQPTDTLFANFEYVSPSQASSLNIVAEFGNGNPNGNGTLLGTAQVVNGYDLHSPGMWLTLTPPAGVSPFTGNGNPYTGTFTGGSILPFILFNQSTYVLQMSQSYCGPWVTNNSGTGPTVYIAWSHWVNGNTNPTRTITTNGSQTFLAIYDQVTSCPGSSASTVSNPTHSSNPTISYGSSSSNPVPTNPAPTSPASPSNTSPSLNVPSNSSGYNPLMIIFLVAILSFGAIGIGKFAPNLKRRFGRKVAVPVRT